jgi:hypothetical protein
MKDYEEIPSKYVLFRPHQSFLVNWQYKTRLEITDNSFPHLERSYRNTGFNPTEITVDSGA